MAHQCGKIVRLICGGRKISYILGQGTVNVVQGIELVTATPEKPLHALVFYPGYTSEVFDVDECVYDNIGKERND